MLVVMNFCFVGMNAFQLCFHSFALLYITYFNTTYMFAAFKLAFWQNQLLNVNGRNLFAIPTLAFDCHGSFKALVSISIRFPHTTMHTNLSVKVLGNFKKNATELQVHKI